MCVDCNIFVVCLGAPNLVVGVCLKLIVKALDSALKDSIVEGELGLCGGIHRRIG